MIDRFENVARSAPLKEFLAFLDSAGKELTFTYREARLISAAIALRLRERGVGRTSWVALDLPNGPEFVLMILAAAYGPFSLILLDATLSASEKSARLRKLEASGVKVRCVIDEERAQALRNWAEVLLEEGAEVAEGIDDGFQATLYGNARKKLANRVDARADFRKDSFHRRAIFSDQQDALDDVIHCAEQVHRSFDETAPAFILFSPRSSAAPRPLMLRWSQLRSTATAATSALRETFDSLSQIVQPLATIQGISVLMRAILAGHGVRLYRRFDATRVLWDVVMFKVTHLTVGASMLKSLLAADDHGTLRNLRCLLIDGRALKPTLAERALDAHIPVFVSYGCPEMAGLAAISPLRAEGNGGVTLLEGVRARILEPDGSGYGPLAISGPGLFSGYLSGRTPFTVDGFFLTGERAALSGNTLFVRERAGEAFVCGGEVVSFEEIERTLAHVPGVWDVHVMDVDDEMLGRRPVALMERAPGVGSELTVNSLRPILAQCFSPMTMPKHLCFTEGLPANDDGLVDGREAGELYRQRIEVKTVKIVRPTDNLLKVVITDDEGRSGVGVVAFKSALSADQSTFKSAPEADQSAFKSAPDAGAIPFKNAPEAGREMLEDAELEELRSTLAPMLVNEAFLHPREVAAALMTAPMASYARHAAAVLEIACWDLYAKIVGQSLTEVFADEYCRLRESGPAARPFSSRWRRTREPRSISVVSCGGVESTIAHIADARTSGHPVEIASVVADPVATDPIRASLSALLTQI